MRLTILTPALICAMLWSITMASGGVITLCQCNIYAGGRYTDQGGAVTYDTAKRFAQWVATINPPGSVYPPIAVIGMQELLTETDRITIEGFLEQYTGVNWESVRRAQGVSDTGSGIGFFWRPDLVETRAEWNLGSTVVEVLDNNYYIRFAGRLFRTAGTDEAFGVISGKLVWGGAILNGHEVTEEERRQEAIRLKNWIRNGEPGNPGMSELPGTTRVVTSDLNTSRGSATYNEMDLEFTDPSSQLTHNSFFLLTRRIDYVMWDRDAYGKQSGGFANGPTRSSHFGSDHRAVYATVNVHPVDLTLPNVEITAPVMGESASGLTRVSASASDASGIQQVQFFIDGVSVWTDTFAPYEFDWDPTGYSEDYHTITAVATDASSNRLKGQSAPVTVWVGPQGSDPTVADARSKPDLSVVSLRNKVVTASFSGHFYIEEADRTSGIKVTAASSPARGTLVTVTGTLNTLNGERQIGASSIITGDTATVPDPLGLGNLAVGGGPAGPYTPGVFGGAGLNNIGLLVSCWGEVKAIVGSYYMYIDDGSKLRDGYGYEGVRVDIS